MTQIAFDNRSKVLSERDALYMVLACDLAMRRDFCPAWGLEPWPCTLYKDVSVLPHGTYYPAFFMDNIGVPNVLGYHDEQLKFIYLRVLVHPGADITADHETKEMRLDPMCDQWAPMPDGREVAEESADPVQGDFYETEVTMLGITRTIRCSNFILPAWFDKDSKGPYDFMGKLKAPFSMSPGGYMIVREDGRIKNVFADNPVHGASTDVNHPEFIRGAAMVTRTLVDVKMHDEGTRTYRRHHV